METVIVPDEYAQRISNLEQEFKLIEQQIVIAQLSKANAQASFRIFELETLLHMGLDPKEFYIDKDSDNRVVAKRRQSDGNT